MNKTELLTAMAEASGLAKKDCDAALSAFIDTVEAALKSGDKVQLVGFGTFEAKERAARTGKNPATGATIEIAASKAPVFKAGKAFKDSIQYHLTARGESSRCFFISGRKPLSPWRGRRFPAPPSYPSAPTGHPHG